jgi:hypothetical protein
MVSLWQCKLRLCCIVNQCHQVQRIHIDYALISTFDHESRLLVGQTTKQEHINSFECIIRFFVALTQKPNWHQRHKSGACTCSIDGRFFGHASIPSLTNNMCREKRHQTAVLCNRCSALAVQVARARAKPSILLKSRANFSCGKLCILQFPELIGFIQGEESNLFTNTLGETIEVKVMSTQDETAELLSKVIQLDAIYFFGFSNKKCACRF